jgi:hypothetical protein
MGARRERGILVSLLVWKRTEISWLARISVDDEIAKQKAASTRLREAPARDVRTAIQSSGGTVVVRTYRARNQEEAGKLFAREARMFSAEGFVPVANHGETDDRVSVAS